MKVGIIVHSLTGNTLSVASKLEAALHSAGHTAAIERVTAVGESPKLPGGAQLENVPDVSGYDALLFGAPVHGFSLSKTMAAYLSGIPSLQGKKVGAFVTQQLSKAWLGGNRAVRQLKNACDAKGAQVFATGVVNWSNQEREKQIESVVERLIRFESPGR